MGNLLAVIRILKPPASSKHCCPVPNPPNLSPLQDTHLNSDPSRFQDFPCLPEDTPKTSLNVENKEGASSSFIFVVKRISLLQPPRGAGTTK